MSLTSQVKSLIWILVALASTAAQARLIGHPRDLFALARADIASKQSAEIHADNLREYAEFVAAENADTDDAFMRPKNLDPRYAREVLNAAERNPVVSLYSYGKYDPESRGIGFCFGRAMFVHLELAYRGLDRDSVRKAFVIGPMKTPDGASWGWHVTTIAQSKDAQGREQWLAIDPIAGVMEVGAWYAKMRDEFSTDKRLKLYVTLPTRFSPMRTSYNAYNEDDLRHGSFNGYFTDMLKWFDDEVAAGRYDDKQIVGY